jgi:hypothetical protein
MKILTILFLALPVLAGCSTDSEAVKVSEDVDVKLCCGGDCETPDGFCCNESHCGGACDETLPVWTEEAKDAAAKDQ